MSGFRFVIAAICFAGLLSSEANAQLAGRTAIPGRAQLERFGLERVWVSQATLNPSRDVVRYISLDEEVVIVQASSGVVTCFDSETGRRFWSVQLGRTDLKSFAAIANEELVIVVAGTQVYGVHKYTGELRWRHKLKEQPSTSPVMDDRNLYIGTLKGNVYAYNIARIQELYDDSKLDGFGFEADRWSFRTGQQILTPPVTNGRVVAVANRSNLLHSIGTNRGESIFQFQTDAAVSAPMAQRGDYLLMASQDFRLFSIDMNNGSLRWIYPAGRPIKNAPRVIGNNVFLTPELGGMFSLDFETGSKLWWRPGIQKFLGATPNMVFASDTSENIVVMNRQTGASMGSLALYNYTVQMENDRTDRLYLATKSGRVVCIRQKGQTFPIYHKFPERRPIMPEFAPDVIEELPPPADAGGNEPNGDEPEPVDGDAPAGDDSFESLEPPPSN